MISLGDNLLATQSYRIAGGKTKSVTRMFGRAKTSELLAGPRSDSVAALYTGLDFNGFGSILAASIRGVVLS